MADHKAGRHLVHSHAHEDIPGTVDCKVVEGDDSAYGQALFPVPADDPNDPLQWPRWKKDSILVICSIYSFLANCNIIGSSVYIPLYAATFRVSFPVASQTSSYPNLCFGLGTILLIPMYMKFGRRPTMLFSQLLYAFGTLGCAVANDYNSFLACRIIVALGSSVCEALPVQCVNDIYFLHERGKRISYYTVALCLGGIGALPAGYMLNAAPHNHKLFFYVHFAFAMALFIATFFLVPETMYKRRVRISPPSSVASDEALHEKHAHVAAQAVDTSHVNTANVELSGPAVQPARHSYVSTLKPWSGVDPDIQFFGMILRSFSYFFVPQVLWVITSFGIYIGCAALAFNYTFPILIVQPPYLWTQSSAGLLAIAFIIGYGLSIPFANSSDRLAARLTVKNNGIREAEMRLGVMLPAMLVGPAGLVVYGMVAQKQLHWVGLFAGVAMLDWSALFYFTFTLAYAMDAYNANMSEMLIAMNIGKNAISFGLGFSLLEWIMEKGYATIIAGAFAGVLLINNLMLFVFMWKGKSIRVYLSKTWLAKMHGSRAVRGEVA
ncbi:hypothetical protein B0A48_13645 [Cryoendolithus antarcticus]|uniref:Major facilitator superfamily (MFS) profile domain-containing protein n=1 Tax=Cryoendolithus antarcticus TaxID=1507870 RepID=A0A1V8SP59_9PEZI|nr:hypothetical protein B0A48_13645 [Cryoendolithus antarcticus]